jgi:hypothetical protein
MSGSGCSENDPAGITRPLAFFGCKGFFRAPNENDLQENDSGKNCFDGTVSLWNVLPDNMLRRFYYLTKWQSGT